MTPVRFYRVTQQGKKTRVLRDPSAIEGEYASGGDLLIASDGTLWAADYDSVQVFDPDGVLLFVVGAKDSLEGLVQTTAGVAVLVDDEIIGLEPEACRSEEVVAPSNWPHAGDLRFAGDDGCEGCVAPPAGCVTTRATVPGLTWVHRGSFPEPTIYVHGETDTAAVAGSDVLWQVKTYAFGPVARGGKEYGTVFCSQRVSRRPGRAVGARLRDREPAVAGGRSHRSAGLGIRPRSGATGRDRDTCGCRVRDAA